MEHSAERSAEQGMFGLSLVFHKMKARVKEVLSYLEGQDFLSIDQIDLDISKFWEVQLDYLEF